jgi:hypothetical protein
VHHTSHTSRNRSTVSGLPEVWDDYADLSDLSRIARYEASGSIAWNEEGAARAVFARMEAYLRPLLTDGR